MFASSSTFCQPQQNLQTPWTFFTNVDGIRFQWDPVLQQVKLRDSRLDTTMVQDFMELNITEFTEVLQGFSLFLA